MISKVPIQSPEDWRRRYEALLTKEGRRHWLAQVACLPQHKMSDRHKAINLLCQIDGDIESAKLTVIQEANQLAADATQTTVKIVRPQLPSETQEVRDLLEGKLVEMPEDSPEPLPTGPVIDFFPEMTAEVEATSDSSISEKVEPLDVEADPKSSSDSGKPAELEQALTVQSQGSEADPEPNV